MRLAAIDIGSNAARLYISDISRYKDGSPDFTKVSLVRIPLRLGFEVFETGIIPPHKEQKLMEAMHAYKNLIQVFDVEEFAAIATSAMRDAKNGKAIAKRVKKEIGIDIDIISGRGEANLLFETQLADNLPQKKYFLYSDVGGGSTEITLFKKNKIICSESFNVGTIRLLKEKVDEDEFERMKKYVKRQVKEYGKVTAVGSGGNINKLFSLSKQKVGSALDTSLIKWYYNELKSMTVKERIHSYKLRNDRADVIVPALKIYLSILKWGQFEDILVPQVGLVDGIIKKLYLEKSFTAMRGIKKKK